MIVVALVVEPCCILLQDPRWPHFSLVGKYGKTSASATVITGDWTKNKKK